MAANGALLTDLYELTMLQSYFDGGMDGTAVFEFFVRALPPQRNFLLAAGLAQVVEFLEGLRFTPEDLAWLEGCGRFRRDFVRSLADLRFTGDVDAMPEGTAFFADEPIVRITAPLREAQLVESRVLNLLHYGTLVASKAARVALAAPGRLLVDFGMRRAHGAEAALLSARCAYLAGFDGTATVEAGRRFGIPLFGTMAHSFVEVHDREADAFARFARSHPGQAIFLIDTYDTEHAAATVASLAAQGLPVRGVRIDSGDLAEHARRVRAILDARGLHAVTLFASGNLDEHRIAELEAQRAPIDGYGVGTRMNTSADAPFLDAAYKLQAYAGRARRKRSEGKATWPGAKQVFRRFDDESRLAGDTLALVGATVAGDPLLVPYVRAGRRVRDVETLEQARARARAQLASLPEPLRALTPAAPFAPAIDAALRALAAEVDRQSP